MTTDKATVSPSRPTAGSAPFSEDAILRMCREAGFTKRQMQELYVTRWKDGIDIDVPSHPLLRFVEIVAQNKGL